MMMVLSFGTCPTTTTTFPLCVWRKINRTHINSDRFSCTLAVAVTLQSELVTLVVVPRLPPKRCTS